MSFRVRIETHIYYNYVNPICQLCFRNELDAINIFSIGPLAADLFKTKILYAFMNICGVLNTFCTLKKW